MAKGDMSGIGDMILGGIYKGEPAADYEETQGLTNDLLGIKQEPLQDLVDKVVKG